ncbi:phosphotransferase [Actinoplanes auranticolor]|uniref:Aminoglycoside phosphotransferase n=1 Tax=Actinoplanes auranticolor TaxID=47988 RepID=A0A919SNM1_9ACTN|nr:phosphotransferase [Actinoplanes auranticolor]GIM76155.1 aminoglycoside phosphotransferase [Actinoplanes auranticolor]
MRAFVTTEDLHDLVRDTYGTDRRLHELARLAGGTTKGVYRLTLDDGATVLLYRWAAEENFWPAQTGLDVGPFQADAGRDGFVRCHALLHELGVRVPEIVALGPDRALVEDVRGGTLEALLERDATAGRQIVGRLGEMLRTMHSHRSPTFGFPGETPAGFARQRGLNCLVEAAARDPRIAAARSRLEEELHKRFAAVRPRSGYGLIHGELGPDHVLIGPGGEPVLIDIEAAMFFDVEWEHAFLELRFGPLYPALRTVGPDPARLALYRLVHYLSLVAGPLQLIEGDFPHAAFMREIAEGNARRALAEVGVR